MKKVSLLMALLLSATIVFAQVDKNKKKAKQFKKARTVKLDPAKVPQAVKDAQTKQFPDVQKIKWRVKAIKTKQGMAKDFIAGFIGTDGIVTAHYKPNGTAMLNIYHLKADKIPSGIASKSKSNYPGFELKRGDKLHFLIKNTTVYRLVFAKPAAKLILYTDESGNDAKKVNAAKEAMGEGDSDSDMGDDDMN